MKFLQTLKNLGKIKEYIALILVVVVKLRNVLNAIESELNGTSVGDKLVEYLPKIQETLTTVENAITKVLSFFGVAAPVSALSSSGNYKPI